MQTTKRSELLEAIRCVVGEYRDGGRRFWNKDVVDQVIGRNGALFDVLGQQLAREKLFDLTRRVMKSAAEMTESAAQLDLRLDVAGFEMPGMIAVPVDRDNPLRGDCEWVPVTEATVADLDANIQMLDHQIEADQRKRHSVFLLRQRLVSVIGEDSRLTVAQAAALSRETQLV